MKRIYETFDSKDVIASMAATPEDLRESAERWLFRNSILPNTVSDPETDKGILSGYLIVSIGDGWFVSAKVEGDQVFNHPFTLETDANYSNFRSGTKVLYGVIRQYIEIPDINLSQKLRRDPDFIQAVEYIKSDGPTTEICLAYGLPNTPSTLRFLIAEAEGKTHSLLPSWGLLVESLLIGPGSSQMPPFLPDWGYKDMAKYEHDRLLVEMASRPQLRGELIPRLIGSSPWYGAGLSKVPKVIKAHSKWWMNYPKGAFKIVNPAGRRRGSNQAFINEAREIVGRYGFVPYAECTRWAEQVTNEERNWTTPGDAKWKIEVKQKRSDIQKTLRDNGIPYQLKNGDIRKPGDKLREE